MRKTSVKVVIFMMLPLWIGLGCRKAPEPSRDISPGEKWLSMSTEERTQAISGFIDGYNLGTFQACGLLSNVFEIRHSQEMNEEEIRSKLNDAQLCQRKAGMYSRSDQDAAYVNVISSFYQQYPSQRNVPPFLLLMNLQDGFDSTVEQLHDSAGKSILRHH
jgi:hypothetical protein